MDHFTLNAPCDRANLEPLEWRLAAQTCSAISNIKQQVLSAHLNVRAMAL